MLSRLQVTNYALIDKLDIGFNPGLNIITGETGAGKSILLGAFNLILGNRADVQMILDKEKKCVVEATFEADVNSMAAMFEAHELDFEKTCIIRREVNKDGKSRAFINDTPVTLGTLKEITSAFVDIHSQRENFALTQNTYRYNVVDVFAGNKSLLEQYTALLTDYKRIQQQLDSLVAEKNTAASNFDFLQFQYNELENAPLSADEPASSERELETLNNAEAIKLNLQQAGMLLSDEQGGVASVTQAALLIQNIAKYNEGYRAIADRLRVQQIEMKDIAAEIETCNEHIVYDAQRIQELNDKLSVINRLLMKHRVADCAALLKLKDQFSAELFHTSAFDDQIADAMKQLELIKTQLRKISDDLYKARTNVIPQIEASTKKILSDLAMPDALLKIQLTSSPSSPFGPLGCDTMVWMFQANKGHELKELDKIASGGEMSRVMLALKAMLATVMHMPTMMFDEIDTGVSGNIAIKVGAIMQKMSLHHQVITITHLPQIAAKGTTHYYVYKDAVKGKTFTSIKKLEAEERLLEVAKMIGGAKPSQAAITSARELMES